MKSPLLQFTHLLAFDGPLSESRIRELFIQTHEENRTKFPYWSLAATRMKLIKDYWYRQVLIHFGILLGISCLLVSPVFNNWQQVLLCIFLAGVLSLSIIFLLTYLPAYYSDFLPKLETIIAEQERIQMTADEIKKCKRTQFSIPTLTVIYFTLFKVGNMALLPCNDQSAGLLNNLFGVDRDKLKQNLARLHKLSVLSVKERAEFQKGIDTARQFFEEASSQQADKIIDQLEQKLHQQCI
jgi:hypothetical protein